MSDENQKAPVVNEPKATELSTEDLSQANGGNNNFAAALKDLELQAQAIAVSAIVGKPVIPIRQN